MTHSGGATQGRKTAPDTAPEMEMKSQAYEAFVRTGQDRTSVALKAAPAWAGQHCSGILAPLHQPALCISQLKTLLQRCARRLGQSRRIPVYFLTPTLQPTHHQQGKGLKMGRACLSPCPQAEPWCAHHRMYQAAAPAATATQAASTSCTRGCLARPTAVWKGQPGPAVPSLSA